MSPSPSSSSGVGPDSDLESIDLDKYLPSASSQPPAAKKNARRSVAPRVNFSPDVGSIIEEDFDTSSRAALVQDEESRIGPAPRDSRTSFDGFSRTSSNRSALSVAAQQVARLQTQSIYNFMNPSVDAVADQMKSSAPSSPIRGLLGSIRGRRRTMPLVKPAKGISKTEVEDIVTKLVSKFGFQVDNGRNITEYMLFLLDSRASRLGNLEKAMVSLHGDFIGGNNANYKTWYFATFGEEELEEEMRTGGVLEGKDGRDDAYDMETGKRLQGREALLQKYDTYWRRKCREKGTNVQATEVALWLLIWGEAGNLRFMPEFLCFIYKCASEYSGGNHPPGWFLQAIIKPTYDFYLAQTKKRGGRLDSGNIIGYDDINEFFRSAASIKSIKTTDKVAFWKAKPGERFPLIGQIDFSVTSKTFFESRTWLHLFVNFSRIIILHSVTFLWYLIAAAPFIFGVVPKPEDSPPVPIWMSMFSLASLMGVGISITNTLCELFFHPWTGVLLARTAMRTGILALIGTLISLPTIFVVDTFRMPDVQALLGGTYVIAGLQLGLAIVTTAVLSIVPSGTLFTGWKWSTTKHEVANTPFLYRFTPLAWESRAVSLAFWGSTYLIKFASSFYYLAVVHTVPMASLYTYATQCPTSSSGFPVCSYFGWTLLSIYIMLLYLLHYLDTNVWYLLNLTFWGFLVNLRRGVTVWAPWREAFSRLPKRIFANLVASSYFSDQNGNDARKNFVSRPYAIAEIWNSVIVSLYNNHLLSAKQMAKMLYEVSKNDDGKTQTVNEPRFFVTQEDVGAATAGLFGSARFHYSEEVSRRLSFFAHSLANAMPEPVPVQNMPTFTVMVPHYAEKMLLGLSELIRVSDTTSDVTLLEYLKFLYPTDWENFVVENRLLDKVDDEVAGDPDMAESATSPVQEELFNAIGFRRVDPKFVLRTRVWASLRTQTLYRTVDGFHNYYNALKVLYRAENAMDHATEQDLEDTAHYLANRKFKMLLAMQRFQKFNNEEKESVDLMFEIFPDTQVAYIEEVKTDKGESEYYSVLIDGHCEHVDGVRTPRFRIKLPGWPILGDGKSDNQNHAIVFTRGEFLQVIDANQEHYLEECYKIRNLLGEFEYEEYTARDPYEKAPVYGGALNRQASEGKEDLGPVAIVGTREHIFSNGVGVLADVTAGKEFVFGTLIQRMLALLGGRLHYGHPDFLNSIWILTRGGVSKAQKSLNLNEDIFAGMNCMMRGARIKHSEYVQCGKGRDLGFVSVINFVSKLGLGVGEQILTREHYVIGSRMALDRVFTFFFGHVGFFIQQLISITALYMYGLLALAVTSLDYHSKNNCVLAGVTNNDFCKIVEEWTPNAISSWLTEAMILTFVGILMAMTPLILQLLTEDGIANAFSRVFCQIASFSPMFEAFASLTYARTLVDNAKYGGAAYVATGRAVSTSRARFSTLYARFSRSGIRTGLTLVAFALGITVNGFASGNGFNVFSILFWIFGIALSLAPFIFNFHQFNLKEYVRDYPHTLSFFFNGHGSPNKKPTWANMVWNGRKMLTTRPDRKDWHSYLRVNWLENVGVALFQCMFYLLVFTFLEPSGNEAFEYYGLSLITLSAIVSAANLGISLIFGIIGLMVNCASFGKDTVRAAMGKVMATTAFSLSLLVFLLAVWFQWVADQYAFVATMFGIRFLIEFQHLQYIILCAIMPPESKAPVASAHRSFFTGDWKETSILRILPEMLFKTYEFFIFAVDFVIVHILLVLLLPLCLIPTLDQLHAFMILWIRPSFMAWNRKLRKVSLRQQQTSRHSWFYFAGFLVSLGAIVALFVVPAAMPGVFGPRGVLYRYGLSFGPESDVVIPGFTTPAFLVPTQEDTAGAEENQVENEPQGPAFPVFPQPFDPFGQQPGNPDAAEPEIQAPELEFEEPQIEEPEEPAAPPAVEVDPVVAEPAVEEPLLEEPEVEELEVPEEPEEAEEVEEEE